MSESLVLDILFAAIIVLVALVGLVRGPARMLMFGATIFVAAELSLWWGDNWGNWIANRVDVREETAVFVCSAIPFLVVALLLGQMIGSVFGADAQTSAAKAAGLILGLINGALLIAMSLRFFYISYENRLASDPLDDTVAAHILWRQFDWFILAVCCAIAALVIAAHLLADRVSFAAATPASARDEWQSRFGTTGGRPVSLESRAIKGVPRSALLFSDNGLNWDMSFAAESVAVAKSAESRSHSASSGSSVVDQVPTAELTRIEGMKDSGESYQSEGSSGAVDAAARRIKFCRNCGMALDESDRFCPDCGFHL
jgi:uncharacterized membrane protein required for colicin V production